MKKKCVLVFAVVFLFFYILNYLTPLSFGDDYVYSFIWQGQSEFTPLTEDAVRVSSWSDLFDSQLSHYLTWSGRTVNHTLAQSFLWVGKDIFNFYNAFISVLLIAEIYWYSHKGIVSFRFKLSSFCAIFFALWAFSPGFSPVFFWLDGACNYLWTTTLLLGFLLPYVRKYYFRDKTIATYSWFKYGMFVFGLIAGWTNENSICWIILVLALFIYVFRNQLVTESWLYTGLAGLAFGYALLMLAPGNMVRLQAEARSCSQWITPKLIIENLYMLAMVFLFQFLLWYFSLRSLFLLKHNESQKEKIHDEILLIETLCLVSLGMTMMMVFSPVFPPRSAFPGTVQLIIAFGTLLRIQDEYSVKLIQDNAKKLLICTSILYFTITSITSLYGFFKVHEQMNNFLSTVKNYARTSQDILIVKDFNKVINSTLYHASGLHIITYSLSDKENDWRNVAFARYYGIKGIRMVKEKESDGEE